MACGSGWAAAVTALIVSWCFVRCAFLSWRTGSGPCDCKHFSMCRRSLVWQHCGGFRARYQAYGTTLPVRSPGVFEVQGLRVTVQHA